MKSKLSVAIFPAAVEENEANVHGGRVGGERGERSMGSGKGRVRREEGSITVYEFLEMAVPELCPILPLSAIWVCEPIHTLS